MGKLITRSKSFFGSRTRELVLFIICIAGTAAALLVPHISLGNAPVFQPGVLQSPFSGSPQAALTATLSQTKFVQGDDGRAYLTIDVAAPENPKKLTDDRPLDLVVVLDTSGSMAAQNKLSLAKQAIIQMMQSLTEKDRFGLVSFSTTAQTVSPLVHAGSLSRGSLASRVRQMYAGGSTNISDALFAAESIIGTPQKDRAQKIILLSDGMANNGITNPAELNRIAKGFNPDSTILSTIGMGLEFNETLLASLADNGMGAYSYLEHLSTLDNILTAELRDLREVYAASSTIQIDVGPEIRMVDAAGYPIERRGSVVEIPTGQLLYGSTKSFVITFDVPTGSVGDKEIGNVALHFERSSGHTSVEADSSPLVVAVVPRSRLDEAIASINKSVYRNVWSFNNLGMTQQAVGRAVRSGDKSAALMELDNFEAQLDEAERRAGVPLDDGELRANVHSLKQKVNAAFAGSPAVQAQSRKRTAKELHSLGRSSQLQLNRK